MAIRLKKKGTIEWVDLFDFFKDEKPNPFEDLKGLVVGIEYKGKAAINELNFEFSRVSQAEQARVRKLRKGMTAEQAPELFQDGQTIYTEEGARESMDVLRRMAAQFVVGIRGVEGLEEKKGAEHSGEFVEVLEELGALGHLSSVVTQIHSVSHEKVLSSAS